MVPVQVGKACTILEAFVEGCFLEGCFFAMAASGGIWCLQGMLALWTGRSPGYDKMSWLFGVWTSEEQTKCSCIIDRRAASALMAVCTSSSLLLPTLHTLHIVVVLHACPENRCGNVRWSFIFQCHHWSRSGGVWWTVSDQTQ